MKLLFFIIPATIASAQAKQTTIKHLKEQRELFDGVDADLASVSSMSMSGIDMPDVIQEDKEAISLFLSKFKQEHIKLAEALSGVTFEGEELAEIVSAQDEDYDGINAFTGDQCNSLPTCIPSEKKTTTSSKSGKGFKSKLFTVERALEAGVLAYATIHDGIMYTPSLRISTNQVSSAYDQTIYNFLLLEDFLSCAGTTIENVLTYKVSVEYEATGWRLFFVVLAFFGWWEECAGQSEDVLPTIAFYYVPAGTLAVGQPTKVMLEAVVSV